jgi:uncharacterized membrane protein
MIFAAAPVAAAALNTTTLPRYFEAVDPYPYISLTFILSMVAALQAPIILMSRTRQTMRTALPPDSTMRSTSRPKLNSWLLQEKLNRTRVNPLEELMEGYATSKAMRL